MKDRLYLLAAPFADELPGQGDSWYCHDCAVLEGALLANPHWVETLDIRRRTFPRPRQELVELIGADNQGMPVLVMDAAGAPDHAKRVKDLAILTDPREIARAIVVRHGGAGPHP